MAASRVTTRFTPVYGVGGSEALCYLIEIDDVCILLDCGWDDRLQPALLEPLRDIIPRLSAVLISHADIEHVGALPYLVAQFGLSCPVYMTFPVFRMGQLFLYDLIQSKQMSEDFKLFTLDDVDNAFAKGRVIHLRYSQEELVGDVLITPFAAGHMLGGAIWKLVKETEEIIYAVDINHRKDHHLDGTDLLKFSKPSVLILDSQRARSPKPDRNTHKHVLNSVVGTLRAGGGGNVLLPVDTAGRCLDLLLLLEQHWIANKFSYPLVLLNSNSSCTVDFAARLIKWMSASITKQFDINRHNPFELKCVQACQTLEDVEKLPGPKVVLCSFASLNIGFAKELFIKWAGDARNMVLFTDRAPPASIAQTLLSRSSPNYITIAGKRRVPLQGAELAAHKDKLRAQRAEESRQAKLKDEEAQLLSTMDGMESSDEEGDAADAQSGGRAKLGFGRFTVRYPMFHAADRKVAWSEYGEPINHADFAAAVQQQRMGTAVVGNGQDTAARLQAMNKGADEGAEAGSGSGGASGATPGPGKAMEVPTKLQAYAIRLHIHCRIGYLDMEGRIDGPSLRSLMDTVRPRKIVLVHGPKQCKETLINVCKKIKCEQVFAPEKGECLDMSSNTSIFQATIRDDLYQTLDFRPVGSYTVAWLDADVDMVGGDGGSKALVATQDADADAQHHTPVLLRQGAMQLTSLNHQLARYNATGVFRDRALVVQDRVSLRRETVAISTPVVAPPTPAASAAAGAGAAASGQSSDAAAPAPAAGAAGAGAGGDAGAGASVAATGAVVKNEGDVVMGGAAPDGTGAAVAVAAPAPASNQPAASSVDVHTIHMEGVLSEEFFTVRQVLYDSYVWV